MPSSLRDLFIQAATKGGGNDWGDVIVQRKQAEQKAALEQQQRKQALDSILNLRKEHPELADRSMQMGEASIGPDKSYLNDLFQMTRIKDAQEERDRRAIQDIEDRATKANTAQTVPALQRGESAVPGLFSEPSKEIQFKSVGGFKTMIPNMAVPLAEKTGILPQGAGQERSALQELANAKIYDSSGKQINEAEMKRIQDAMGMRGLWDPQEIQDALRQMGYTVFTKQRQVSAGAKPEALQEFKKRGGLAGYETLPALVGTQATGMPQQQGADIPPPNGRSQVQQRGHIYNWNPKTGQYE